MLFQSDAAARAFVHWRIIHLSKRGLAMNLSIVIVAVNAQFLCGFRL
jgi:hypothetical protein